MNFKSLKIYEKLNCWCNKKTKDIIILASIKTYFLIFESSFPYLFNPSPDQVIEDKDTLEVHIRLLSANIFLVKY